MSIVNLVPHTSLTPYIKSYRLISDMRGKYSGVPIETCPEPIAILSINYGQRAKLSCGSLHPRIGILGIQTHKRVFIPQSESCFVMAIVNLAGLSAMFPGVGVHLRNNLIELSDIVGQVEVSNLYKTISNPFDVTAIKIGLDAYFTMRLSMAPLNSANTGKLIRAVLESGGTPANSFKNLGMSSRTFQRHFKKSLGITHREYRSLIRFSESIKSVADGRFVDLTNGYSDQSHAIREWTKLVDTTPYAYGKTQPTALSKQFHSSLDPTIFYL